MALVMDVLDPAEDVTTMRIRSASISETTSLVGGKGDENSQIGAVRTAHVIRPHELHCQTGPDSETTRVVTGTDVSSSLTGG